MRGRGALLVMSPASWLAAHRRNPAPGATPPGPPAGCRSPGRRVRRVRARSARGRNGVATLGGQPDRVGPLDVAGPAELLEDPDDPEIGRASCRERVEISVVDV